MMLTMLLALMATAQVQAWTLLQREEVVQGHPALRRSASPVPTPTTIPAAPRAGALEPSPESKSRLPRQAFRMPLEGVPFPSDPDLWPGAPRAYRQGVHRSVDFYAPFGTPVLSSSDGVVVRACDESRWAPGGRDAVLGLCQRQTPEAVYQLLVGRHVIVHTQLGDGTVLHFHYNHLSRLAKGVLPGARVKVGQVLGEVGNSGTSSASEGTTGDSHLDFAVTREDDGSWLGQGLSQQQTEALYRSLFRGH
jgi:murein DD-endopeptidase MepM/ murein hydrolase activator NlpD